MLSHLKRRIGVLTAVAVLAALVPTLSISSASAAASATAITRGDTTVYSACPGSSAASAGFTDTTSTDVDCIAMHGITSGVTATTYEPSGTVPRWQMALFLTRFATAGSVTLGSGADQGFTDISGKSAEIQTAINQLKQLGVTNGTTATTYSPDDNVTREQMAMFIERMLGNTFPGPGGNSDGASTNIDGDIANLSSYTYTDIDSGGVTFEGHNAIIELLHLGVTGDTGAVGETYRPSADITRAEMATMMTSALAHSNARPAGVWVQSSLTTGFDALDNSLHISHRDSSRVAVPGTLIDVFSDLTATNTDPFAASGACAPANTVQIGGTTECAIALGDASTDVYGNVAVATGGVADVANGTTVTYWAWTGAVGATYDNDTPANSVVATSSTAATKLTITTDASTTNSMSETDATYELVKFGSTVTITGQLQTAAGVNVAQSGVAVTFTQNIKNEGDSGTGRSNDAGGTVTSIAVTTATTDANGTVTFAVSVADPTAAVATVTDRIQTDTAISSAPAATSTNILLAWDDNPSLASSIAVVNNSDYGAGVATASGGVSRTATATVYDQFGVGMANQTVTFESSSTNSVADPFTDDVTRVTDSSGVATLGYTDGETSSASNTVYAWLDNNLDQYGAAAGGGASDGENDANEVDANDVFYRTTAVTQDFAENDTTSTTAIGTNFTTATATKKLTFGSATGLAVGDEIGITTLPATTAGGKLSTLTLIDTYYVIAVEAGGGIDQLISLSTSRGGTIATVDDGGDLGADTPGVAGLRGVADEAGDNIAELVIDDGANDTLVMAMNNYTGSLVTVYSTISYDDNDVFQTSADAYQSLPTGSTLTDFETAVTGKFTSGVPTTILRGDVKAFDYQAFATSVATFQLGQ